jgi:1,4-dihydroxy-6-naphthoate synthase
MKATRLLVIACTPESDDAFYYDALENGEVELPGYEMEFQRHPLSVLNRAGCHGKFDITAISSVLYPQVAQYYAILSVGTSVGRGYGPVLVSREARSLEELYGRPVGVAGIPTTGWFLLRCLCPEAVPIEMPFDRIADAVCQGELEAGVMIHEELLHYPRLGLHRVVDLGGEWCQRSGLPLPIGLNVIRRDIGVPAMQRICAALARSVQHGLDHSREALRRVCRFGSREEGRYTDRFVSMFANADSVNMPDDVRMGLRVLLSQVADLGLIETIPPLDVVHPAETSAQAQSLRAA